MNQCFCTVEFNTFPVISNKTRNIIYKWVAMHPPIMSRNCTSDRSKFVDLEGIFYDLFPLIPIQKTTPIHPTCQL